MRRKVLGKRWTAIAGVFCHLVTDDGACRLLQVFESEMGTVAAVHRWHERVHARIHTYELTPCEFYHVELDGLFIVPRRDDAQRV